MLKNFPQQVYVVEERGPEMVVGYIKEQIKDSYKGECEFISYDYQSLSINDTRFLKSLYREKNGDIPHIYFISFLSITKEAGNSVLKMIEEPGKSVYFFIIVPNKNILLKTILSRSCIYELPNTGKRNGVKRDYEKIAELFLKSDLPEKLKIISSFIEEEKDENNSTILMNKTLSLVNSIGVLAKEDNKDKAFLESIFMANVYLRQTGSSPKMILENCAISLS